MADPERNSLLSHGPFKRSRNHALSAGRSWTAAIEMRIEKLDHLHFLFYLSFSVSGWPSHWILLLLSRQFITQLRDSLIIIISKISFFFILPLYIFCQGRAPSKSSDF